MRSTFDRFFVVHRLLLAFKHPVLGHLVHGLHANRHLAARNHLANPLLSDGHGIFDHEHIRLGHEHPVSACGLLYHVHLVALQEIIKGYLDN